MPSLHTNNFDHIQENLGPETLGVLWLSTQALREREDPFVEIDYFFDGILTQRLINLKSAAPGTLVVGEHFGNPIFLGQVESETPQVEQVLKNILNVMKQKSQGRSKILVIGHNLESFPKSLKKKFPELDFQALPLEDGPSTTQDQ